jgi:hypothetical protein
MHSVIELRKARRYVLNAPALFMWASQDGTTGNGRGVTRDINTSGVFVITETLPVIGARIQMDIALPKITESGSGMLLHGEGIVLRAEARGLRGADRGETGFAASVQFYPNATGLFDR